MRLTRISFVTDASLWRLCAAWVCHSLPTSTQWSCSSHSWGPGCEHQAPHGVSWGIIWCNACKKKRQMSSFHGQARRQPHSNFRHLKTPRKGRRPISSEPGLLVSEACFGWFGRVVRRSPSSCASWCNRMIEEPEQTSFTLRKCDARTAFY